MPGIYIIINTINGHSYIGSTNNLKVREDNHFTLLKHNKHVNSHLQNAYNKYSNDAFVFLIKEEITECDNLKELLLSREQYYIDNLKPEYNILKVAGSTLGFNHSEETKLKISNSTIGVKKSAEHAQHISDGQKGKHLTEEHKQKLSEAAKTRKQGIISIISVDGVIFTSLKEAAEILNVKYNTLLKRLKSPNFENYIYIKQRQTKQKL